MCAYFSAFMFRAALLLAITYLEGISVAESPALSSVQLSDPKDLKALHSLSVIM